MGYQSSHGDEKVVRNAYSDQRDERASDRAAEQRTA